MTLENISIPHLLKNSFIEDNFNVSEIFHTYTWINRGKLKYPLYAETLWEKYHLAFRITHLSPNINVIGSQRQYELHLSSSPVFLNELLKEKNVILHE